jgi:DNA-binding MarR family transcriptional regulator
VHEEASGFGRAISIINRKALAYFSRRLKPLGLGPGQQAYLLALDPGEAVPQEELARRLSVDKANVSRAVRGLEELGYLRRVRSGDDARAVELSLTESGRQAREAAETIAADWIALLKRALSADEWRAAESALERIAAFLDEREVPAPITRTRG